MLKLQFYTRPSCTLCHSALAVVHRVQQRLPFLLEIINIDEAPLLRDCYDTLIPVLCCGDAELARAFFDEKKLSAVIKKCMEKYPKNVFSRQLDIYKA